MLDSFLMKQKLEELGLRKEYEEPVELHCGLESKTFWNIEELFGYPQWVRLKALEEFIWEVGKLKPQQLFGILRGGHMLAREVGSALGIWRVPHPREANQDLLIYERPAVLVDDVLTTGGTVQGFLESMRSSKMYWEGAIPQASYGRPGGSKPDYIVVLVNRSNLSEIEGIPVISGIEADFVER